MDILGIAAIPVITVICYGVAEVIKATQLDSKWLPAICIVLGAVLGVVALYIAPNITPATDVLTALAIGVVSGCLATSVHQTIKQISEG